MAAFAAARDKLAAFLPFSIRRSTPRKVSAVDQRPLTPSQGD